MISKGKNQIIRSTPIQGMIFHIITLIPKPKQDDANNDINASGISIMMVITQSIATIQILFSIGMDNK